MPSIHGQVTRQTFQQIADRVDKRLAGWKTSNLSMAGRATLIQATVSAIPSCAMQKVKIPRSICDEVDRKARCFLWGGNDSTRKIHNVSWNQVAKNNLMGGLGVKSMRDTNVAFLTKLGWRVLAEKDRL